MIAHFIRFENKLNSISSSYWQHFFNWYNNFNFIIYYWKLHYSILLSPAIFLFFLSFIHYDLRCLWKQYGIALQVFCCCHFQDTHKLTLMYHVNMEKISIEYMKEGKREKEKENNWWQPREINIAEKLICIFWFPCYISLISIIWMTREMPKRKIK